MAKVKEPSNQISEEDLAKIMKGTEKSGAKVTVGDPGSAPGANEAKAKESYEKISKAMSISMGPKTNSNKDVVAVINKQIANDTKNTNRMIKALAGIEKATTEQSSILKESLLENKNNLEAGILAPDSKIKEDKEDKEKKEEKGPVQSFLEKLIKPALMIAVGAILMSFDKIKKYYDENIKGFVDGLTNLVGPGGALALLGVGIVALLNPLASLLAVVGAFAAFKGLKNLLSGPKPGATPGSQQPGPKPGATPGSQQPGAKGPSQFTQNPDGTITNQKGATFDPKTGTGVGKDGKPLNSSATKAMKTAIEKNPPNSLKKVSSGVRSLKGLRGPAALSIGLEAVDYFTGEKEVNARNLTGSGGGVAGAMAGASIGATLGAPLAPFTFGLSSLVGGVIGGTLGYMSGSKVATAGYDALSGEDKKEKEAGDPQREGGPVPPKEIFDYLTKERGIGEEHASGILANIQAESSFDPGAIGDNGNAGGLFQHNGPRFKAMKESVGEDWKTNWKKQVDFALSEPDMKSYLEKDFADGAEAAADFSKSFERPAAGQKAADFRATLASGYTAEALGSSDTKETQVAELGPPPQQVASAVYPEPLGPTAGKKLASDTKETQMTSINPPAQAVAPVINNITTNNNNPAGQSSPGVINKPGADINPINQMWNTFAFA